MAITHETLGAPPLHGATGESKIQWGAIVAGAIAASALAFVLHSFAIAIGLSTSSTAPTWRDASFALVALSGLYLIFAAVFSYGFGAFVAGSILARNRVAEPKTFEFHDGIHGLLVWALATLLTAVVAIAAAQTLTRLTASSGGSAGLSSSVAGENIIAFDLDRLFRAERAPDGDVNSARAEAGRILLTAASHSGLQADDRSYLIRLVSARTGLAQPDALRRVDEVVARAKENITRARRSGVLLGFMVGAAALLGAAVSWFAASAGGDRRYNPYLTESSGW